MNPEEPQQIEAAGPLWQRTLCLVTGARPEELTRVVLCFVSLFFLLLSYYLIKPLRNSQFLKEFDAGWLPVMALVVPLLSLAVTALFNAFVDRYDRYRVVIHTYFTIAVIKLAFTWFLLQSGRLAVVAFYFFASVYFLLAIAIHWACINDIFSANQSKRCFGTIALGSMLGSIFGSRLSAELAESTMRDYATVFSAAALGLALACVLRAAGQRRRGSEPLESGKLSDGGSPTPLAADDAPGQARVGGLVQDVRELLQRPYMRRIAAMVLLLAVFNSIIDFVSQRAIDSALSRQQFVQTFQDQNEEAFRLTHQLKTMHGAERDDSLVHLSQELGRTSEQTAELYSQYRAELEAQTRLLFSNVFFYQGLVGVVLLLFVVRYLFTRVGLRYALLLLPMVALVTLLAFALPIDLLAIQVLLIVFGSVNYSLNNAAKEVLYSATDRAAKFKYKPLIEGPAMRAGDFIASVSMLLLSGLAVRAGWGERAGEYAFMAIAVVLGVLWLRAAYQAGREFDSVRDRADPA